MCVCVRVQINRASAYWLTSGRAESDGRLEDWYEYLELQDRYQNEDAARKTMAQVRDVHTHVHTHTHTWQALQCSTLHGSRKAGSMFQCSRTGTEQAKSNTWGYFSGAAEPSLLSVPASCHSTGASCQLP